MEGAGAVSPEPVGTTRNCIGCGRSIPWQANVCPYCGHDYRIPAAAVQPKKQSSVPIIAGILIVLAGILAIALGAFAFSLTMQDLIDTGETLPEGYTWEDLEDVVDVCGALFIVFGFVAVLGGVMSVGRKHFALSVIGGIFGILGVGFGIGALLAIIGLILLLVARKEFK